MKIVNYINWYGDRCWESSIEFFEFWSTRIIRDEWRSVKISCRKRKHRWLGECSRMEKDHILWDNDTSAHRLLDMEVELGPTSFREWRTSCPFDSPFAWRRWLARDCRWIFLWLEQRHKICRSSVHNRYGCDLTHRTSVLQICLGRNGFSFSLVASGHLEG